MPTDSSVSLDAWRERIEELGEGEFMRRLRVRLAVFGSDMVSLAKQNATTGPKARTGRLRSSIRFIVTDDAGVPQVHLQAGGAVGAGRVVYAGMQEFGGTVTPKSAGDYLRIPIKGGPALTSEGVDRYGGPLRSYDEGFFVFMAKSGKLYIGKSGDFIGDGAPRAWYALKRSVKIPRNLFLGRAVAEASGKLEPMLGDLFKVALSFDRAGI